MVGFVVTLEVGVLETKPLTIMYVCMQAGRHVCTDPENPFSRRGWGGGGGGGAIICGRLEAYCSSDFVIYFAKFRHPPLSPLRSTIDSNTLVIMFTRRFYVTQVKCFVLLI